jgi:hypothetical protein
VRKRLRHLPPALLAAAAAVAGCALLGGVLGGATDAAGAAAGAGLAAFSFALSSVVLAWADTVNPRLVMPVGLVTYVLKFAAFGVLLAVVADTGWAGMKAVAAGLIAGTVVWATTQAVWVFRSRIPYVDLTES